MSLLRFLTLLAGPAVLGLAAPGAPVRASAQSAGAVPLLDGLGSHHHPISSRDSLVQRYFDQGLRLTYAFNHPEAIRAFAEAARRDTTCAICHWGVALAYGPNINLPMDSAAESEAYAAVRRAQALASHASPAEREYIDALARRYGPSPAGRAGRDSAYATAMAGVARRHPGDPDARVLYAEAMMDLRPWNYWTARRRPQPGMAPAIAALEAVIRSRPDHPGACHYYIHAVEAAYPERAVACAERLAGLMPAAGHLVHMPAHIYIRVGRYADAIRHNVHAVHADESYIADQRPSSVYPAVYYPHNYHFLAFAATMAADSGQALVAARALAERVSPDVARQVPFLQVAPVYPLLTLVTFGRWDEALRQPLPSADLPLSQALSAYGRGIALTRLGRFGAADSALADLARLTDLVVGAGAEPAGSVAQIAKLMLTGEIAEQRRDFPAALAAYRAAATIEDAFPYEEPPQWYYPVRHSLGRALLAAGRAADAERTYRSDLDRFPENPWSLAGLAESLEAQGRRKDAVAVRRRLDAAAGQGAVALRTSRF